MSQQHIHQSDIYSTQNLALAAAISLWFPIESIDRTHPRKVNFIFLRDEQLDDLVEAFWKREVKVEALAYFNQLKVIKGRIYGEK
jgi:hypothetical protein